MRTANVSEVDLWDSDYSIEMADGRLTLAEYADGATKKTDIPDLDTDAALDTMGMAAAQITSNLKAALMDYMHDAGIKTYETDFKDSTVTIDISHDDIQVQLGNDNAFMHINELDDLTSAANRKRHWRKPSTTGSDKKTNTAKRPLPMPANMYRTPSRTVTYCSFPEEKSSSTGRTRTSYRWCFLWTRARNKPSSSSTGTTATTPTP